MITKSKIILSLGFLALMSGCAHGTPKAIVNGPTGPATPQEIAEDQAIKKPQINPTEIWVQGTRVLKFQWKLILRSKSGFNIFRVEVVVISSAI